MQYSTLILALGLSTSLVLAAPAPSLIVLTNTGTSTTSNAASAAEPLAAPAASSSTKPSSGSGGSSSSNSSTTAAGGACSSSVTALAAGISSNIADQNNELTTVTALGNVLAQVPMDMTLYAATQSSLMGFVVKGITIRENNQKIAPAGNAAIAGLAIVAMAQKEELNLTMSLAVGASGTIDPTAANATVETLKKDFAGGIVQNMKNLAAATGNCTVAAGAASTAPAKVVVR